MKKLLSKNLLIPSLLFLVVFIAGPIRELDFLALLPGDIGDPRLNHYFLENIFQYFFGNAPSLIHLGFYYPFPYTLGFSDNLFGTAPLYIVLRFLTPDADVAFQFWYLLAFPVNFIAAYYALRKLKNSYVASSVGSLIFTFALPAVSQYTHPQLQYRFGVPLSIFLFLFFLQKKEWKYFLFSSFWLVWQFYCSIYVGFFTLMILVAVLLTWLLGLAFKGRQTFISELKAFITHLGKLSTRSKWGYLLVFLFLLFSMLVLFYPYLKVTQLYGIKRTYDEIKIMLPRLGSYLIADYSPIWKYPAAKIADIPARQEHQLFVGAVPLILAAVGLIWGNKRKIGLILLTVAMIEIVIVTVSINGRSLWILFSTLPLASAIRAMTRVVLVLLFPVAYLAATGTDFLLSRKKRFFSVLMYSLILLLIVELSTTEIYTSTKEEWKARLDRVDQRIPKDVPPGSVIFVSQEKGPPYADEIDVMWIALKRGYKTYNGYTGYAPPNYHRIYNKCTTVPKRIMSYLAFIDKKEDKALYKQMMDEVVTVGLEDCSQSSPAFDEPPLTLEQTRNVTLHFIGWKQDQGKVFLRVKMENRNDTPVHALSFTNTPVLLSWRTVDAEDEPSGNWNSRFPLPADIKPHSYIEIDIPLGYDEIKKNGFLQITWLQEYIFWAHDRGVKPLTVPIVPDIGSQKRAEQNGAHAFTANRI